MRAVHQQHLAKVILGVRMTLPCRQVESIDCLFDTFCIINASEVVTAHFKLRQGITVLSGIRRLFFRCIHCEYRKILHTQTLVVN